MMKRIPVLLIALTLVCLAAQSAVLMAQEDNPVDLTQLPLGDGMYTFDRPQVGYVYSCTQQFGGGGAFVDGEWIQGDTYDLTAKTVTVDGAVLWDSEFTITLQGNQRMVSGNGLPDHATGNFPVASTDDAYNYDRNPNRIQEQDILFTLPADPVIADQASCVSMGAVGILLSGGVFFNALDARGEDAVAHEIQDNCDGHPEMTGEYHYHSLSNCIGDPNTGEHSELVGYALDGFGIFGRYGEDGEVMTTEALDECHGHIHEVEWDGELVEMYHYHATWEFPYTVGCYRGTPITLASNTQQSPQGGQVPAGQQPPAGQVPGGQMPPPPPGRGRP